MREGVSFKCILESEMEILELVSFEVIDVFDKRELHA